MDLGRRVALVCAAIPCGRVASYGQIAALCGQVGQALHRGASDTAHRVVNSQGRLSGAAAFLVAGLQRRLLEAEGVEVLPGERVELKRFGWKPDEAEVAALDAAFVREGI